MTSDRASWLVRRRPSRPSSQPQISRAVHLSEVALASPFFAYAAVIAVQLRVIWKVWEYKDLTSGDTSSYFLDAVSWAHGAHDDILWSPLYTNVWGSVYALIREVYASEMVMRVGIVLLVTVLVLAIMRSLFSPAVALLIALWWAIVPANYNVLYEVHLFGVLPILLAVLIVAKRQTHSALGVALAIFLGTTILLRNELLIATLVATAFVVGHELRGRRLGTDRQAGYARAYGVPLLIVIALAGMLYARSFDKGHDVAQEFKAKQGLNACQAYVFNYQQRHPSKFTGNPFTECQPLMRQTFGEAEPSFLNATRANPRAMAAFVAWNGRLLGSGLQVSLFNATSTRDQPDYPLVNTGRSYALILSLVLLELWIAGFIAIRRDWSYWRDSWLADRLWIGVFLGAACITTIAVALSERPRPEYMYALTVGVLAVTGVCATALLRRIKAEHFVPPTAITALLLLLALIPGFYRPADRPLLTRVQHLASVSPELQQPGSVLIASGYNYELCSYLAETHTRHCTSPAWPTLQSELVRGVPLKTALNHAGATAIYMDSLLLQDPRMAQLAATPRAYGWREVSSGSGSEGRWQVLIRAS
jgi:hypothetical protein